MTDGELLEELLFGTKDGQPYDMTPAAREAFTRWHAEGLVARDLLTPKQLGWLHSIGERHGLVGPAAANLFSGLSPKERERQRAAAAKVKLPWEK